MTNMLQNFFSNGDRVIIAGGRDLHASNKLINKYIKGIPVCCVVCGLATGIDTCGKDWAIWNNIPVKEFPANWDKYGKKAGMLRNKQMADFGDILLLLWDGNSSGSRSMKQCMEALGKRIIEVII